MDLLKQIVARAQSDKQRIVLPEAEEERTLKAADRALQDGLADIILIGNPENIRKEAEEWGLKNIDKATIVDPKNNPRCEEYAEKLAELRKKKGMTIEQARKLVTENNLYLGCMIIKTEGGRRPDLGCVVNHGRDFASRPADHQVCTGHLLRQWSHAPAHPREGNGQRWCDRDGRCRRHAESYRRPARADRLHDGADGT